jgi:thiosulfate/3-mercaptopyruvate sulfurtransferase
MNFLQETPMIPTPLIDAATLHAHLAGTAPLVLLDCGFDLTDPAAGERAFADGHLPGAAYAHLDRDLAGARTGSNGRHPLPTREAFASTLGRWGVAPGVAVVAYDDHGGVYASRAWWMLRWAGHAKVAVLDGGWQAWERAAGAVEAGTNSVAATHFEGEAETAKRVLLAEVPALSTSLVDARDAATLSAPLALPVLLPPRPAGFAPAAIARGDANASITVAGAGFAALSPASFRWASGCRGWSTACMESCTDFRTLRDGTRSPSAGFSGSVLAYR